MQHEHNNYKGWLNSDNFWKRSLAVYGYSVVGSLVVALPFLIIIFLFSFTMGAMFGFGGETY
jgi:hypothetical protein